MQLISGTWEKTSQSSADAKYAEEITFETSGIYSAKVGAVVFWDCGSFRFESPHEVRISNAFDGEDTYQFQVNADRLIFIDPAGCQFEYRKTKNPNKQGK